MIFEKRVGDTITDAFTIINFARLATANRLHVSVHLVQMVLVHVVGLQNVFGPSGPAHRFGAWWTL